MTSIVIIQVALFALLFASMALALCITSTELHLHNLAGAVVVTLGGWLAAELVPGLSTHDTSAWCLLLFLIAIIAIASLPLVAARDLRHYPLLFLFASLGVALFLTAVAKSLFLPTSSASLTSPRSPVAQLGLAVLGTALAILATCLIFNSRRWHALVIQWRIGTADARIPKSVAALVLVQTALLLVIGICFTAAHKGLIGAAEYKTVFVMLAVFATRFRPIQACLLAGALGGALPALDAIPMVSGWSETVIVVLLGGVVIHRFRHRVPTLSARRIAPIARTSLVVTLLFCAGGLILTISSRALGGTLGWTSLHVQQASAFLVLVVIAWAAYRILGVLTVTWPAVGGLAFYVVSHFERHPVVCVALLALLLGAVVYYLFLLRAMEETAGLVVDLGLIVALHLIVLTSEAISGANNTLIAQYPSSVQLPASAAVLIQGLLIALVALCFMGLGTSGSWRGRILSVASPVAGARHGHNSIGSFCVFGAVLVSIAMLSALVYHSQKDSICPAEISVVDGLKVLLFAYIGALPLFPLSDARRSSMWAIVLLCSLFTSLLMAWIQCRGGVGRGLVEQMIAGGLFVAVSYIAPLVGKGRHVTATSA